MPAKQYKYLPLHEIVLRKYEKPDASLSQREQYKRLCLSLGLLQPGDSRDIVVDVLAVLLAAAKQKKMLDAQEIQEQVIAYRKQHQLPLLGIAPSNIRRQMRRMRQLFLVEKIKNKYRITEFMPLSKLFEEKLLAYLIPSILSRVKEYIQQVDET
ncbi:MAG: hypothetical protein QW594_03245 [Candidatus Woesearchaeota archaeon]